ncbi:ATP-binding cassette domain-containing protein [Tuanshanicoccus lijuaniae]|uniref:ATP-binding cassette domain-containing protein n=1 Tax=Aerococcaceae bacterium zg-1292 TaxID=2774330 RepID=UPI001BD87401|nr:ABC transporter ATP-binding protein [Aerococcaceae bacterium zg-A91]MBS4458385.1 ABC transporter ATP-binding protein [Aerococcaceae bacterium zg-BR33]
MMSLKIENVNKNYFRHAALIDVECEFLPGKIYGLLGRNGAGKSTLLNIIAHRINKTSGAVTLDGESIYTNEAARKEIFLSNDETWFDSWMRVTQLMEVIQKFHPDFDYEFAESLFEAFELNPKKRFKSLSTGYRSIAKLIIALCMPSQYIFLDEPVLGLDAHHRKLFNKKLIESYERKPRTFVISTHMIEEVAYLLEAVVIIDRGMVKQQAELEEVLNAGYVLTGTATQIDPLLSELSVLNVDELGQLRSVSVLGEVPETLPEGVEVHPLGLQDYFIHTTMN